MKFKDLLKDAYKDGMTLEEIEAALAEVELPEDLSTEVERLKTANSKLSSENADWKRKHREALSEEERKSQEVADELKQLREERDTLLRESNVSKHKAKFLGMGYDEALATDAAVAMVDGDMEKLFSYQQKHQEAFEKKIRADALKGTPKPVPDKKDGAMTLENLKKMSTQERLEFFNKNPEEYKTLYGGN